MIWITRVTRSIFYPKVLALVMPLAMWKKAKVKAVLTLTMVPRLYPSSSKRVDKSF
jgi:hypothetical protein